jgi:ubiquinone biosynthesis protein COQ9
MKKPGKPDRKIVIDELIELRYKRGYSNQMLVVHLQEKWGYEHSRSYDLVREMKAEIGKTYNEVNKNLLEDAVEFMESMKAIAVKEKNHKMALEWQKEIDKVQQLHVQKLEIDAKIELPLFGPIDKKSE